MKLTRRLLAVLSLCALLSCGGGTEVATNGGGVGTGGTGISLGTVTGFGSVVLDGVAYSSATPRFIRHNDSGELAVTTAGSVQLGAQALIETDSQGNASSVLTLPDLQGTVASVDAQGLVIHGVPVRVNSAGLSTWFSGLQGLGAVRAGMQLAASGSWGQDASGQAYLAATLLELLPASSPATVVSGTVSGFDADRRSFRLGTLQVSYAADTGIEPAGIALADGLHVHVVSAGAPKGGSVVARTIRIRSLQGRSGSVQLAGLVQSRSGSSLRVGGVTVDASGMSGTDAVAAGQYVLVQGTVESSTGRVTGRSISAVSGQQSRVELNGTISGYLGQQLFYVRGVAVDASRANFPRAADAALLANGVPVRITASVDSANPDVLKATSVSVAGSASGSTVNYQGVVSGLSGDRKSFTLTRSTTAGTVTESVTLASNVAYGGSSDQLVNGAVVDLEGTASGAGVTAYSVQFPGTPSGGLLGGAQAPVLVQGRARLNDDGSVSVNGVKVRIEGTTVGGNLSDGSRVDLWVAPSGSGGYAAKSVKVRD